MTEHRVDSRDGFEVHLLRTREVEVEIIPTLGAKISGLRSLRTGREWLWSPPGALLFRSRLGDPYAESNLVGADECFPTIGPCAWAGRELPDHGEAWTQPWEGPCGPDGIDLRLACPVSPFALRRRATLEENRLIFSYVVENRGDREESYLWAFHPFFALQPGDRLEVPAASFRADLVIGCPLETWDRKWDWPAPLPGVRLDALDFGPYPDAAAKVYTEGLAEGRAALYNDRTGDRLEFAFDLAEIGILGLWINGGGWSGFRHLAIEPTCGAPDRLDLAAATGRSRRIAPGAAARWSFTLTLS